MGIEERLMRGGAMKFEALATDYDGTIAHDGIVDQPTLDALGRARRAGIRLIMVTGRELPDLLTTFPHAAVFDRIVAENGAVLYDPATMEVEVLAAAPPAELLERLAKAHVPLSVGHSIVATDEPHAHQVLLAIQDLRLEWHVIFNKGSVMALPAGVSKATGLARALAVLGLSAEATVGVGDAENDQALLRACRLGVAVANALDTVKQMADVVTAGARGAGVAELIDRLIGGDLDHLAPRRGGRPTPVS
jgi:hydroxymethylpyrimidine pyrophosphatase-like HAD family hydrolase